MNRITDFVRGIKLFLKNVWLLLSFDPWNKPAFSFLCGIFSLIICNAVKGGFSRLFILSKGIRYIDKGNMVSAITSFDTLLLVLLFLIIMTYCALFEIGGLLHSFSMAQVGRRSVEELFRSSARIYSRDDIRFDPFMAAAETIIMR